MGTEPCCPLAEEEKGKTTEMEFVDAIGTKILRLLLVANHSVSSSTKRKSDFTPVLRVMHLFPIITKNRISSKEGKPDRKPYHPYGFRNDEQIHTEQSNNKENSSLFMYSTGKF